MAALFNALDNITSLKIGEKGHKEYGWSTNIQEKITQFSFQITRVSNKEQMMNLEIILREILTSLKVKQELSCDPECHIYLSVLYKIIGQTRDIIDGKGEYELGYMMIRVWHDFYPELALFALECFVKLVDKDGTRIHQYGSWKDIKYFCEHCRVHGLHIKHPLIQYAILLINNQLRSDDTNSSLNTTLAGRWVPRERKAKFGWLYEELATSYFPQYLDTAKNDDSKKKAYLKCKMEYRKLCSRLNKKLDTLQIKQAGQEWSKIDFDHVTSISLSKQRKAFLNVKGRKNEIRHPFDNDRIECATHFNEHIQKGIKGEIEIKGKRLGLNDFTKTALSFVENTGAEIELLNLQWKDNSKITKVLENMVAMCDISGSMAGEPLNAAIALSIRVAEKSKLGKRVMSFSVKPSWINLEKYNGFVDMAKAINYSGVGYHTDLYAAFKLILDTIIESEIAPEDVEDMVLAIFSDMQIDDCNNPLDNCIENSIINKNKEVLYDTVNEMYSIAGMRSKFKRPFKPPHILFWNLRSTNGFPTLSIQQNVSMMSGFSPNLLNMFCEKGLQALKTCTPWSMLTNSLENERYKILGNKVNEIFL